MGLKKRGRNEANNRAAVTMDTLHLAARLEGEVVIRGSKLFCQSSTLCCGMSAIPQISSAAATLCLGSCFSSSTVRKTSPTYGFVCRNENMEVPGVKTLWKHMNESWALFLL